MPTCGLAKIRHDEGTRHALAKIVPVIFHYEGGLWRLVHTAGVHAVDRSIEGLAPFRGNVAAVG